MRVDNFSDVLIRNLNGIKQVLTRTLVFWQNNFVFEVDSLL